MGIPAFVDLLFDGRDHRGSRCSGIGRAGTQPNSAIGPARTQSCQRVADLRDDVAPGNHRVKEASAPCGRLAKEIGGHVDGDLPLPEGMTYAIIGSGRCWREAFDVAGRTAGTVVDVR